MKRVTVNGQEYDFDAVVNLMDDDLRNHLQDLLAELGERGSTAQRFVDDYCLLHADKFGEPFVIN